MKTLLFILLKVGELAAMAGVLFGFYFLGCWIEPNEHWVVQGLVGLRLSLGGVFVLLLLYLLFTHAIPWWIKENKKLVNKIMKKL